MSAENKQTIDALLNTDTQDSLEAQLIENGQLAFETRLALIQMAKQSIDISYYRTEKDATTDIIYGALIEAAHRGVTIRLLVDGKLGGVSKQTQAVLANTPNITLNRYNTFKPLNDIRRHR